MHTQNGQFMKRFVWAWRSWMWSSCGHWRFCPFSASVFWFNFSRKNSDSVSV